MNEGLLSKRYAKALLEYAVEKGEENTFYDRMRLLSNNIAATPRIKTVLSNPMVTVQEKTAVITEASGGNVEENFGRFVAMVMSNRREHAIREIALSYMSLYRRFKNITVVAITTVTPLSQELIERIRTNIEGRTKGPVEIVNHIDASINGGFVLKIDDSLLDASVAGQLERIRKQLIYDNRKIV